MNKKSKSQWYFQRKTAAPSGCYIKCKLGMLPVFKLIGTHKKFTSGYFTQTNITAAHFKISFGKTHG